MSNNMKVEKRRSMPEGVTLFQWPLLHSLGLP